MGNMAKSINRQKGFTIVETMIVLAIVGAIMLVVFLAVPALQRNSRNTQRRSDVSRIGGAVNEFMTNNNGKTPASTDVAAIADSAGTMSQYAVADITVVNPGGVQSALADQTKMKVVVGAKCGASGATVAGTTRQMAVQFMVESGSSYTAVCQEI
jgi:prepilin-type N-terminal cleavage/methylation domain-containing protein